MAEAINTPLELAGVIIGALILVYALARGLIALGEWIGAVNTDRRSLHAFMVEVRADIKEILRRLSDRQVSETASPLRLTEFGKTISKALEVERWARTTAAELRPSAEGKAEFEIFDLCVDYVAQLIETDQEMFREMRSGAYQHGIGMEQVQRVYEIELRDALLAALGTPPS